MGIRDCTQETATFTQNLKASEEKASQLQQELDRETEKLNTMYSEKLAIQKELNFYKDKLKENENLLNVEKEKLKAITLKDVQKQEQIAILDEKFNKLTIQLNDTQKQIDEEKLKKTDCQIQLNNTKKLLEAAKLELQKTNTSLINVGYECNNERGKDKTKIDAIIKQYETNMTNLQSNFSKCQEKLKDTELILQNKIKEQREIEALESKCRNETSRQNHTFIEDMKACIKEKDELKASFTQLQGVSDKQSKNISACYNVVDQIISNNSLCQEKVKNLTGIVASSENENDLLQEQYNVCLNEVDELENSVKQLQGVSDEKSTNISSCYELLNQQMVNNSVCQEQVTKLTGFVASSGKGNESMMELFKVCTKEKEELNASLTKLENTSFHCKNELNYTQYWYNECFKSLEKVRVIVMDPKIKPKRKRQTHNEIQLENIQLKKNLTICIHRSYNLSMSLESEKVIFQQEMKKLNESLIYCKGN